jgi:hypothetical protein
MFLSFSLPDTFVIPPIGVVMTVTVRENRQRLLILNDKRREL